MTNNNPPLETRPNRIMEQGNILPSCNAISVRAQHRQINEAYATWVEDLVTAGWTPYLLTFMFRDLDGSRQSISEKMEQECYRVYATMLTRVIRHPRRQPLHQWPRWFCCHDRPVYKHAGGSKSSVLTNDGHHLHVVALQPSWSRLQTDLVTHVEQHDALYVRNDLPLIRLHITAVTERPGYVVEYVRKQIGRLNTSDDIDFMLPRLRSEIQRI